MGELQQFVMGWLLATLAAILAMVLAIGQLADTRPAMPCHEDEAAITVDYRTPGAWQDEHGVTRQCINLEELGL